MKRLVLAFILIALQLMVWAQYCGGSGDTVCTVSGTMTEPGLLPSSTIVNPLINGGSADVALQFKNFDSLIYNGITIAVNSLRIDSIGNLPNGTCWKTNKTENTFQNREHGCIKISGFICSDPGQYKLRILVTAQTSIGTIGPNLDAEMFDLKYYFGVRNLADNIVPIDTSQTLPFVKSPGYAATSDCTPNNWWCVTYVGTEIGIHEVNGINTLSIVPNPFTNKAVVSFTSERATVMTERLTNILGAVVAKNTINVKAGENSSVIDGTNLNAGVYFYSLTDGKNSITKRVVISE